MNEQMHLERPVTAALPQSNLKTLLFHIQDDEALDRRLDSALSIARSTRAHLSCLHVTPIQAYVAFDSFGGVFIMKDVIESLEEQETALRTKIEARLRMEDVTWDYEQVTGDLTVSIVRRSALSDMVVVGRNRHRNDGQGTAIQSLGELLYRCRTPIFVPGDDASEVNPVGHALIAWDGSFEAANAVRGSLGLLAMASDVSIVHVPEEKEHAFPGTKLLEYLSRQGIHAELTTRKASQERPDPAVVAATITSHAKALGAEYIVMGGYSHNRVRECILGGVTRDLLMHCAVPLVMAR